MANHRALVCLTGALAALGVLALAAPALVAWGFVDILRGPLQGPAAEGRTPGPPVAGFVKFGAGIVAGLTLFLLWRWLDFREALLQERRYRESPAYLAAAGRPDGGRRPDGRLRLVLRAMLRSFGG